MENLNDLYHIYVTESENTVSKPEPLDWLANMHRLTFDVETEKIKIDDNLVV